MDITSFVLGLKCGKKSGGGGGDASLNIAYGDTAPTDTSKLWVKTAEPNKIHVGYDFPTQEVATIAEGGGVNFDITKLSTILPKKIEACGVAKVDTNIYIMGGYNRDIYNNISYSNTIYKYDIVTDTMTELPAKLPQGLSDLAVASVGDKIYTFGGRANGSSGGSLLTCCFDTLSGTISQGTALSNMKTYSAVACAVGTDIFVFGGSISGVKSSYIYKYDTTNHTVTQKTSLPTGTSNMGAIAVGTDIYVYGGSTSAGTTNTIYRYDTVGNTIETLSMVLPISDWIFASCVTNNCIYALGSYHRIVSFDIASHTTSIIYEGDGVTFGYGAIGFGNRFYTFGGLFNNTPPSLDSIYNIELQNIPIENGTLVILQSKNKNTFALINTNTTRVEIGVDSVYKGNSENIGEKVETALYKDGAWSNI